MRASLDELNKNNEERDVKEFYDLIKDIPLLISMLVSKSSVKEELAFLAKLFEKLSVSSNMYKDINAAIIDMRLCIENHADLKEEYEQIIRAKEEIKRVLEMPITTENFSKKRALIKEKYAVSYMHDDLKSGEIAEYMNNRYKKELSLKNNSCFTARDINSHLSSIKEE